VSGVDFVIVGPDFMTDEALRASLHPFFWKDVAYIERLLGVPFDGETRLWGRTGDRTDAEIAEALNHAMSMIKAEIADPVSAAIGQIEFKVWSWTDLFGRDGFGWGWEEAHDHMDVAERIYDGRTQTRDFYAMLDRVLGRQAGLNRTLGNNAIYLAVARWIAEHPEHLIVDFEVDRQFWDELRQVVTQLWKGNEYYIASAPAHTLQPWAY
jgi:hypothetical protein